MYDPHAADRTARLFHEEIKVEEDSPTEWVLRRIRCPFDRFVLLTVSGPSCPGRCTRLLSRLRRREREPTMHDDRDPFRAPRREPKPGTFHRPAHGFGMKRAPEVAKLRLSGLITGEQKLGEGLAELPLGAVSVRQKSDYTER
jgi:hypothetical protein